MHVCSFEHRHTELGCRRAGKSSVHHSVFFLLMFKRKRLQGDACRGHQRARKDKDAEGNNAKVRFCRAAAARDDFFKENGEIDEDLKAAIDWTALKEPTQA